MNQGNDFSNWGIKAATQNLLRLIESKGEVNSVDYISHEVLQRNFSFDPVLSGKRLWNRQSRVAGRLFGDYIKIPRIADEFEGVAEFWISSKKDRYKKLLNQIKSVDILVFNAEGSTYRNNKSAIRALFILWIGAKFFNKRCFFLNGSVTLSDIDPMLPAMVEKTFSSIAGVTLREPKSYRTVTERWPHLISKVSMAPDSAFYESHRDGADRSARLALPDLYFCFSTSMMPVDFKFGKSSSSLLYLLKELSRRFGTPIILARDIEDQFLNELSKDLDCIVIGKDFSYEDVIKIVKGARFLLSGRYHHLIFSYMSGTPFIAMDTTSHKIKGLVELACKNPVRAVYDPTNLKYESKNILKSAEELESVNLDRGVLVEHGKALGDIFKNITLSVLYSKQ